MTAPTASGPSHPHSESQGIAATAMRLLGSLTQHLQSLALLAGMEGREAAALYVRLAIVLGAGLFLAAFGYVFVVLFVAFGIAALFGISWIWISLGLAVLHLAGAAAAGFYVKKQVRTPVFRATAEEIRKDAASLRGNTIPLM